MALILAALLAGSILACGDAKRSPMQAINDYYQDNTPANADVLDHRPLVEDSLHAVFATTLQVGNETEAWYTFLSRENKGRWVVDTIKTLDFPDSYDARVDSIVEGLTPDSLLPPEQANLPLTVAPDSAIKAYLVEHHALLDSIVNIFTRRAVLSMVDVARPATPEIRDGAVLSTNRNARIHAMLERARVTRVFRDARHPKCTFVRINGIDRLEVGFLYADEGCVIPSMTPDGFIYVEQAVDHWYVYKVI